MARTSAWVRTSPAPRCAPCSPKCWPARRLCASPVSRPTCALTSSAASSASPSPGPLANPKIFPNGSSRLLLAEVTREVLDAVDEAGQEVVRLARGADVRYPGQQFAQDGGDLAPGQVRAKAEVRARRAEADVRVGGAGDVEPVRVG